METKSFLEFNIYKVKKNYVLFYDDDYIYKQYDMMSFKWVKEVNVLNFIHTNYGNYKNIIDNIIKIDWLIIDDYLYENTEIFSHVERLKKKYVRLRFNRIKDFSKNLGSNNLDNNSIENIRKNIYPILISLLIFKSLCIIHRDIKKENIVVKNGKHYLIDYGLSMVNLIFTKIINNNNNMLDCQMYIVNKNIDTWGLITTYLNLITYEKKDLIDLISNLHNNYDNIIKLINYNNEIPDLKKLDITHKKLKSNINRIIKNTGNNILTTIITYNNVDMFELELPEITAVYYKAYMCEKFINYNKKSNLNILIEKHIALYVVILLLFTDTPIDYLNMIVVSIHSIINDNIQEIVLYFNSIYENITINDVIIDNFHIHKYIVEIFTLYDNNLYSFIFDVIKPVIKTNKINNIINTIKKMIIR